MSSEQIKKAIMARVVEESNHVNSREFLDTLEQACFQACFAKPGSSLSKSDEACAESCVAKYIQAWNHVNSTFINRLIRLKTEQQS